MFNFRRTCARSSVFSVPLLTQRGNSRTSIEMANYFPVLVNPCAVDGGLYSGGVAQEVESVGAAQLVGIGSGVASAALAEAQGDVFFATTRR